jgi:HD-like signal output (HDOD) protein
MPELLSDQTLAEAVEQLPPAAAIIRRLLAALADPNSDIDDISRIIRVDTVLATQVLRLANSAHMGLRGSVTTVEEAVQQAGMTEIARLASALSAKQLSARQLGLYRISPTLLWQHTLAVAVAAELLASRFLLDESSAYLAGLLHTIGIVTLDTVGSKRASPSLAAGTPLLAWEHRLFGTDNASVSQRVLTLLDLPARLADAVASRYTEPTPESIGEMRGLLYLASALAEKVPAGLPPETGLFKITDALLESLRLSREEWTDMELDTAQRLSRLKAIF